MRHFFNLILALTAVPALAIPAEGHQILIAGPSPYAVEVGRKVAAQGGNVVDVAVAVGLTLSVTSPYYAALGGGGFALVKMDARPVSAVDFREMAPAATSPDYFAKLNKDASITGGAAVGVPGFAAGLWALHQKFGKLKWSNLFTEPIRLARQGFPVSGEWVRNTRKEQDRFSADGLRIFFKNGVPYRPGDTLRQPQLAQALIALRDHGAKGFYEGSVARDVVTAVKASGGNMTEQDLKNYKVRWLEPLTSNFDGYKIYLMPPPSSGGVVLQTALKLIDKLAVKNTRPLSVDEYHLLAQIESRAFRGRELLGDPDFNKNPLAFLTSEKYVETLARSIDPQKTTPLEPLKTEDLKAAESTETTHFSILDTEGHAVALTVTLNGTYGSGVVTPRYGIALNNEMDDFTTHPNEPNMYGLIQGQGNSVEPGKRPLSSMSPTLVEKNGKIVLSLGAPGGPRIITGVLQALYRTLVRGADADAAIQIPRVHHQFRPDILYVDQGRFAPEVLDGLRARGHKIEESDGMARVYMIRLRPDGVLEGAFDARGEGAAGGI